MAEWDRNQSEGNSQELEFDQPVVNIGSHPENDAVISGAGVLPFHAMLMIDEQDFRLVSLAPEASVLVDGALLQEKSIVIKEDQRVDIGSYSLAVKHNGTPTSLHLSVSVTDAPPAAMIQSTADHENAILLNVLSKQVEVEVEHSAIYQLEIVNAGPIVASFTVSVKGLPEEWIQISPNIVNLNESQRSYVQVTITPPRAPSSTAGKHPVSLIVTSPNYPGQRNMVKVDLTILPYYEFMLGSLSPRQQTIRWRKHTGIANLPIANGGNSPADFTVSAMDEENGCSFDFQVNETLELNRQAVIPIPAGETFDLPIAITPHKQPVISLRNRRYHYTTTVQVAEQAVSPQIISGTVVSTPLFGWLSVLLVSLMLALGIFFLVQPRITKFQASANKDVIELGDSTRLEWTVSPFATRLSISGIDQPITRGQKHATIAPKASTTYELLAGNWLSGMMGLDQRKTATILVVPPSPRINVFEVDEKQVDRGKPIKVRWSVTQADKVILTIDEVVYELPVDEFSGERLETLKDNAIITLEAINASGSELRSFFVNVKDPRIKVNSFVVWVRPKSNASIPIPTVAAVHHLKLASPLPQDSEFSQEFVKLIEDPAADSGYRVEFLQPDRELAKGEQVLLEWNVDGVTTVNIAPFTETLPNRGKQPFFPQESMNFVLTAKSGELERLFMLPVKVFDGQPPEAPKIEFLKASPLKAVGPVAVQFAWSVSGNWTRVQLSTEGQIVADYLNPQGFKTVTVTKSTTFILTAWNGELSSAAPLEITIDPTLTPVDISIVDVLPNDRDRFMIGDTVTVQVAFGELPADKPKPTGIIIVTDGVATCSVNLPSMACDLQFKSPGNPVLITASYQGDSIYLQADSNVFEGRFITVTSAVASLSPTYYQFVPPNSAGALIENINGNPLQLDEGLFIRMEVKAVGAVIPVDSKGQITISICERIAGQNVVDPKTCAFYPTVSTVTVDAATGTGSANIAIPNLPQSGNPVLLFEYRHAENAISPTSFTEYGVTVDKMQIALGLNICTNPINFSGCTTGVSDPANARITFDILKALGNTPLSSALPKPANSDFKVFEVDANNNKVKDWSCSVVLATTPGGGVHKLECIADLSGKTAVNFRFTHSNSSSKNYFMGNDRNTNHFSNPYGLTIKTGTVITMDMLALQGIRSGQLVQLTPPGVLKLTLADVARTPITNTTGQISMQGESGLFGIKPGTTSQNCSLSSINDSTDEIRITAINSECPIYFKKAGSFNVLVAFAGDSNFNASSSTVTVTVAKQLDVTMTWKSSTNGTVYEAWNITSLQVSATLYGRIEFGGGLNFSPAALQGQFLSLKLTPSAGSCQLITSNGTVNITSSSPVTVDIPILFLNNITQANFQLLCTTDGAQITMDADIKANAHFSVGAGQIKTRSFFIVSQPRGNVAMTISLLRSADNAGLNTSIQDLYVGEVYRVTANVGVLWADGFGNPPYPTINSAIDYYIYNAYPGDNNGTLVSISLPQALRDRVDWTRSNCESTLGARDLRVRMDQRLIHWSSPPDNLDVAGASDITISNAIPCTLVFLTGQEVNQQSSVAFSYSAVTPNYGYQVNVPRSFSTNGLTRQGTTLSASPALSGTGWVGVPVTYTLTVSPVVANPSNPPIDIARTFEDHFAVSLPQNCAVTLSSRQLISSTTASFTLTPTQSCSGGVIEVLYKGNDWFKSSTLTSTAINFQSPKTTTVTTPSANPASPTTYGQNVLLSTNVTATGATPTGTVTFKNGNVNLCSANLSGGAASCTAANLAVGSYSITAIYEPSTGEFVGSTSTARSHSVVKATPTISLQSTPSPASITVGSSITFTATLTGVTGAGVPTGSLTFTNTTSSTVLCPNVPVTTPSCGPISSLPVGSYSITVSYSGDTNYNTASSNLSVQVNKATPTMTLVSSPVVPTIFVADSITFTAAVSGVSGVSAPTGTVNFTNGAATLCANVPLSSGSALCGPITSLAAGTHTIAAAYSGDANYIPLSRTLTVTVNKHTSSAGGLEYENAPSTWVAFAFNTNNNRAAKATDYKLRVQVTDNDDPVHTAPIPTGQVEIWLVNNSGVELTGVTDYTISQVTGAGAVTYDAATKRYKVTLNSAGEAIFTIRYINAENNVTLRYKYLGDNAFERSPLSTDNPDYKVSPVFSIN
jgi:hypothetical protein